MRNKKPPFEITNAMIDHVAEIAELVGRLTSTNQLSANPTLRRTNRIRTIHGSLAIEQNTLTLEQVTAVLNGKQVLAPPKDIKCVGYINFLTPSWFSICVIFHTILLSKHKRKREFIMWQDFEKRIRNIASYRWNCNAVAETIAGVKCDCILKPQPDHWIIVEITEECNLEKIRTDIAKLFSVRNALFLKNVYCHCYIVTKSKPTDSMRSTGTEQNIHVKSAEEFQNEYFEYSNYIYIRNKKQFGSLINIDTGEPENNIYISLADTSLKIFFQPGAGRKEAALLRGMGAAANKQLGEKILSKLLDEKLITRIKGDEGYIYKPVRSETGRIDKMLTDLTLSTDPLWQTISALS